MHSTSKPVRASQTTMAHLMMPHDANLRGTVHGGVLLSYLDKVAAVCAMRHSEATVVTASVDSVVFRHAIHVGELVTFYASVNFVGRTSMEIGVKIVTEDVKTGRQLHSNSCYLTMVAVDDDGKPQEVPHLVCETEDDKRRWAEAEERRAVRLKLFGKKK
ncbi:MAG: acyl-CoA thioesterase [bacterium]